MAGQPEKTETVSQCALTMHDLVAQSLQAVQPHPLLDPSEIKWHAGEFCSAPTSATVDAERDVVEVEIWPTAPGSELADLSSPDPTPTKDQKYNSQAKVSLLSADSQCLLSLLNIFTLSTSFKVPPICCFWL